MLRLIHLVYNKENEIFLCSMIIIIFSFNELNVYMCMIKKLKSDESLHINIFQIYTMLINNDKL